MSSEREAMLLGSPWRTSAFSRQWLILGMLVLGFGVMYAPVFVNLSRTVWNTDEQGHGPIILAVVAWLFWQRRLQLVEVAKQAAPGGVVAWAVFILGLLTYFVGRLQNIVTFEMLALIILMVGVLAVVYGWKMVKLVAFPIFFLLFAVPLPGPAVDALTAPLKQGVSWVSEQILYAAGYPISRSGVILMIGPYQLLVADACAGLNSMFTLEALGLLYMNMVGHTSRLRNILLAILIVPMSFTANVIRVLALCLITYYLGDEAGQGILHGAAGMLLFGVALALMLGIDSVLGLLLKQRKVVPQ